MKVFVVTLFPELFDSFLQSGLLGRAIAKEKVAVEFINPREFTHDKHRTVDDTPYGGGSGMVMKAGPLIEAMEAAEERAHPERPLRVLLTPQGQPFDHRMARKLAGNKSVTMLCGRYEGIDERARRQVDLELSLGDFVLMGGEIAAMAIIEASARFLSDVLGNPDSLTEESHADGKLEYPHYTRPAVFRGEGVPEVLTSGNHKAIEEWRREQSLLRTRSRRPDLLRDPASTAGEDVNEQSTTGRRGESN